MSEMFETTIRRGMIEVELGALSGDLRPKLADPASEKPKDEAHRPPPAPPTQGPHGYTIYVPNTPAASEESIFNIGAPGRILDLGITGHTRTHIHFKTTTPKTMLALGGPSKEGWAGFKGNKLEHNTGFMAVTECAAFIDARDQLYLVSREADVVARAAAGRVRLHADKGSVEAAAKEDVKVAACNNVEISANTGATLDDNDYKTTFHGGWPDKVSTDVGKTVMSTFDVISSIHGLMSGFKTQNKVGDDCKVGWVSEPNGTAKMLVDTLKLGATLKRFFQSKHVPGQVKIAAETFVSLAGATAASVYGTYSASLTSLVSASVVGGTATMKAATWGGIWAGTGLSLKTISGKLDVKNEKGKTSVVGFKGVKIGSDAGNVLATAKGRAVIESTGANGVVHGATGAMLTAGPKEGGSDGFGVIAHTGFVEIGHVTNVTDLESGGTMDNKAKLHVHRTSLGGVMKDSRFDLNPTKFEVEADVVNVIARKHVFVKGKKAYLL